MRTSVRAALVLPLLGALGAGRTTPSPADTQPFIHQHTDERLVAEAQIWGADSGRKGYSFLPVTIQGHAATIIIDLNCTGCDLALSTAALQRAGITPPSASAKSLDTLTIGNDVQYHVPLSVITKPTWSVPGPKHLPPVVGIFGVHFLTTHYDILYDFPARRVKLYALPAKPDPAGHAWLPPGFTPKDCGERVEIPPGAGVYTGVKMVMDGHPVTGAFEMGAYVPKINQAAVETLGLSMSSPRVQKIPGGLLPEGYEHAGYVIDKQVPDVHATIGTYTFWSGRVLIFPVLDVQSLLPAKTPVLLLDVNNLHDVRLLNSTSSKRVCVARP